MKQTVPYKTYLNENEIPTRWYNLRADMKNKPAPLLNPQTLKPMTFEGRNRNIDVGNIFVWLWNVV